MNNPQAKVITNKSVAVFLEKEEISYILVDDGKQITEKDMLIEGLGWEHAEIYKTWKKVENTSYFISEKLFYPGDAFLWPPRTPEILALPVAGPWCKISEVIDYAFAVKPRMCFPVHDGVLAHPESTYRVCGTIIGGTGIEFKVLELGKEYEF